MIVQCDWLSVSGCVENVLVGGRNFNKFKSVPVTDKCCHGGTEDPGVVTPSHHQEISYVTHCPGGPQPSKSEQCEAWPMFKRFHQISSINLVAQMLVTGGD